MDDSSSLSSEEIRKKLGELFEAVDLPTLLEGFYRDATEYPKFIPVTLDDMKSRGGVTVPRPVDPVMEMLRQREQPRHRIAPHLYETGNYVLRIPPGEYVEPEWYRDKVVEALAQHSEEDWDPLVIYVPWIMRNDVFAFVHRVEKILRKLNAKHEANHIVDWWYRPVGQAQGHALVAIRMNGLYELAMDDY
jgi:hypothetical protein